VIRIPGCWYQHVWPCWKFMPLWAWNLLPTAYPTLAGNLPGPEAGKIKQFAPAVAELASSSPSSSPSSPPKVSRKLPIPGTLAPNARVGGQTQLRRRGSWRREFALQACQCQVPDHFHFVTAHP
jgi:hypothetical protein